jgi:hypothetical protein
MLLAFFSELLQKKLQKMLEVKLTFKEQNANYASNPAMLNH